MKHQIEIVESICSGTDVERFLKEHKLELKDVRFEKRCMDKWDDYQSVVVYSYRDATPEEALEIEKKQEAFRLESLAYRKEQFDRLKKEFGES